jgi:hypothetical protein
MDLCSYTSLVHVFDCKRYCWISQTYLPLVEGVMVDYHTKKINITRQVDGDVFFLSVVIYHTILN